MAINIITLILLFIKIINFILAMSNKHLVALNLLNILFLSINIILEIIIWKYLDHNEFLNGNNYYNDKKAKYNYYLFALFCVLCADYLTTSSYMDPESHFYLILVYPFRYGFDWQIFDKYKEKQNNLDNNLNQLNLEIENYEDKMTKLDEEESKISGEIEKNKKREREKNRRTKKTIKRKEKELKDKNRF